MQHHNSTMISFPISPAVHEPHVKDKSRESTPLSIHNTPSQSEPSPSHVPPWATSDNKEPLQRTAPLRSPATEKRLVILKDVYLRPSSANLYPQSAPSMTEPASLQHSAEEKAQIEWNRFQAIARRRATMERKRKAKARRSVHIDDAQSLHPLATKRAMATLYGEVWDYSTQFCLVPSLLLYPSTTMCPAGKCIYVCFECRVPFQWNICYYIVSSLSVFLSTVPILFNYIYTAVSLWDQLRLLSSFPTPLKVKSAMHASFFGVQCGRPSKVGARIPKRQCQKPRCLPAV